MNMRKASAKMHLRGTRIRAIKNERLTRERFLELSSACESIWLACIGCAVYQTVHAARGVGGRSTRLSCPMIQQIGFLMQGGINYFRFLPR